MVFRTIMASRVSEHARPGAARVGGHAARVAGASTGSASDQGKVTRVGASELGQQTSFKSLLILIRSGDICRSVRFILIQPTDQAQGTFWDRGNASTLQRFNASCGVGPKTLASIRLRGFTSGFLNY